ncbi:MAG: FoF1 ATP synthase subunit delta/epsilon [Gemmatimonadota bacterium]
MREAGARRLKVSIISPTEVGFEGEGESIIAPAYDGKLGILYGHAPMMVLLGAGEVVVRDGTEVHRVRVARGFLQVIDNQVSVLAEEVEPL